MPTVPPPGHSPRESLAANTQYDFKFDSAVTSADATKFQIVDSISTSPGGVATRTASAATVQTDTTVVRATFASPGANTPVRGVAFAVAVTGSLTSGQTANNVTETEDIAGSSGDTNAPDLVSVTLDTTNNRATFTFDEAVETLGTAGSRTGFHLYYRNGTTVANSSLSTDKSTTDNRSIIAQFATGEVNEAVAGGYADEHAVTRSGQSTVWNGTDEEGVVGGGPFAAGAYLGPNLTTAARSSSTSFSGTVTVTVAYTFDKAVTNVTTANFAVVSAAGVRSTFLALTGGACALASGSTTVVNCTVTDSTARGTVNGARLATVAYDGVRSTTVRTNAPVNPIPNHEERNSI
jgi:hypothetical protein